MIDKNFKLIRNFSIVSFGGFLLTITSLAVFYRQQAVSDLVFLMEKNNIQLTQFFANTIWEEYQTFLSSPENLSEQPLKTNAQLRQIEEKILFKIQDLGVIKVKIYDLQGRTVFSTDFSEIGENKSKSSSFLSAKSGQVVSKLGLKNTLTPLKNINSENRDLLSSYIPIRGDDDNRNIVGVFELYTDVTPLLQKINQTQRNIILGSLLILIIIYGILILFVRRADILLKIQYHKLQASEKHSLLQAQELTGVLDKLEKIKIELQNTNERLQLATRAGKVGVWDWDIPKNYLTWDDCMYEMYNIEPSKFTNKVEFWEQVLHPEDAAQTKELLEQSIQGENTFDTVFRIVSPNGSIRWIEAHAVLQKNDRGEPQRMVGMNFDVSSQKLAQVELQYTNAELARATKLKDEFLANMSHELRTPLNAILGMTEALLERFHGEINEEQKDALQLIDESGNHLLQLINDILDLAKIESQQMELLCKPTKISDMCEASMVFIQQQAFKKRIKTHLQITPNLPELMIDERRIRKVLINLLNNAVKFTSSEGSITLQVTLQAESSQASSAHSSQTWIRFSVIDTGIGMSQENIQKLFQPFVQIDSALNRKYSGTGLGLSLVKQIVELHGGKVGVRSQEGVGSCFWFDLPCDNLMLPSPTPPTLSTESVEPPIQVNSNVPLATSCILLAEDNLSNIKTISGYLKIKGYQIIVAHDGQEAVEMAKTQHPDLILMDIQMPKLDGLEAMKQIRQHSSLENTPIIALTALAMDGDREKCLAAGATDYFSKPVRLRQLTIMIEKLLHNSSEDS